MGPVGKDWRNSGSYINQLGGHMVTTPTMVAAKVIDESTDKSETIELTIYTTEAGQVEEGTYDVDTDEMPKAQISFTFYEGDEQVTFFSTVGTVTMADVTASNIKGSFAGTVANPSDQSDTKVITNGAFDVATFNY